MKKPASLIFMLLILGYASAQKQYVLIYDKIPAPDTVWVFSPVNYDPDQSYPVVYMLHGYSSDYRQWHKIMNAQDYADRFQMIIVCPDGFYDSWYLNSPGRKNSQFIDFFFEKLVTTIENEFKTDPMNRFITGLSMGGHGALHLYLRNPDFFNRAGSTSGVMDLRAIDQLFGINEHLSDLEGNEELWLSLSAMGNMAKFKEIGREIILDCGTEDPFHKGNKAFYEKCLEEKIPVTFISQTGKHDWDYWEKSIDAHFRFFDSNRRK
jgi:S-formylglutathione hydrolase FrmB